MSRISWERAAARVVVGSFVVALAAAVASAAAAEPPADAVPASDAANTTAESDLLDNPSLRELVDYATRHNPGIRAARFEMEAARKRIVSQSWYENPTVIYAPDTGARVETRAGAQANGVQVSQAIPFPGKLTLKGRVEEDRANALSEVLRATIQEVSRQVRARYADYYLAARSLVINAETTDLTQQFSDVAQAKYRVGTAAQQDVILVQEQLSRLRTERIVFRSQLETARGALNALLDRAPRAALGPPANLSVAPLDAPLARLLELADRDRPELRSQDHLVEASDHSLALARMGYLPDFKLVGQWTGIEGGTNPGFSRDGRDVWEVKLGFSVPLWLNRIGADVDEKEARMRREKSRRRDLTNRVRDQVQRHYERLVAAVRTEEIYRNTLIPQTTARIAAARAGYQTGDVDFLTLIDSLRSLEDVRLQRDRAVRDYQRSAADLERAVGRPIPGLLP